MSDATRVVLFVCAGLTLVAGTLLALSSPGYEGYAFTLGALFAWQLMKAVTA